jgi:hypothetical protein
MKRTTAREDERFIKACVPVPDTPIIELEVVGQWIADNFNPEDIFSDDQLSEWASENDYVKKE